MGIFSRQPNTIVASAVDVSPTDEAQLNRISAAQQPWQRQSVKMFSELAEIHYPGSYVGSALGRFSYPVAILPADDRSAEPVVPDQKDRDEVYRMAEEIMFALEGDLGGMPELARLYGINMTITADGWLVGDDRAGGMNWEFLSVEELTIKDGKFFRAAYSDTLTADAYTPKVAKRFWEAHPFRTQMADSPMQSLLEDCERLIALNQSMKSRILSRLAQAGIMIVPSEMEIVGASEAPTGDGQKTMDPFFHALLNGLEAGSRGDNRGGNRVMPMLIRGPATASEAIRFLTMDRTIDRVELELRAETRHNLATGLDLPPEVSEGLGAANHWSSWGVNDSTYSHLEPKAIRWAAGVTKTYLWPALRAWAKDTNRVLPESELRRYVLTADGSMVKTRPNQSEDMRQLRDRLAVKDSALRKQAGVGEDEKPTEEEYVRQLGVRANNPYLATFDLGVADKIDWEKVKTTTSGVGAPGAGGTPPSRRPADSSDPAGAPGEGETQDEQDRMGLVPVFAASAGGYMLAAQKMVGAKVRALAEPHPVVHAELKSAPNEMVLGRLDSDMRDVIGLTDVQVDAWFIEALAPLADQVAEASDRATADAFVLGLVGLAARHQTSPPRQAEYQAVALRVLSSTRP